ncbi:unnamed protein product [Caenorhabditis bovis]|uniref:Zinc metalloproteinase n=1 Tax=Caenorhabditis bovis TaxID=2654633 RepID=A0A8S1EP11_9PELO|nr:unnamed protein product [Caenorhabditis bovis]
MHSQTCFVLLATLLASVAGDYIANDVVSNYAEVKEILRAFYKKHAKKYGHDYDPNAVKAIADNLDKSIKTDKTEATVNRKLWNEVFENDIILTLPQAESLLKEANSSPRSRRQAHPDVRNFWPNLTISYEFYGGEESWRQLIRNAIRHVEQNVCFRFKENGPDRDGLRYYRGNGCWSNVGRVGGRQSISIGYGCDSLGIVSHETLHALGLWHEQSRVDRDDYIAIVSQYITRGTEGNFAKRTPATSDNLGQPYDLGSVMHYGAKSFSYDWTSDTILTRDRRYQNTIGQRDGLSFKDAKMINIRYCSHICRQVLPCVNEGYTDPNNCNQCRCPSGYGGTYCEKVQQTGCGGTYTARSEYQTILSGEVYANANCVWRLRNPGGQIDIIMDTLNFQCTDPCTSYVEIKWLKQKTSTGARFCCSKPAIIRSEGEEVIIIFRGSSNPGKGWKGFSLRYQAVGGTTTTSAPTTTRPYWTLTASGWVHIPNDIVRYTPTGEVYTSAEDTNLIELASPISEHVSMTHDSSTPHIPDSSNTANTSDTSLSQASTNRPIVTTTTVSPYYKTGSWGLWGEWSVCSQPCGGCGKRTRVRACYGGNEQCHGSNLEDGACNTQACAKPKKGMICNGRLLMPCDLIPKLKFGSNNFLNPKLKSSGYARSSSLPLPRIAQRKPPTIQAREVHPPTRQILHSTIQRVKRQSTTRFCEKRFFYQCPTALLTVNIEYKDPQSGQNDAYFQQYPECCAGYAPYNGVCYKS